MKDYFLCDIHFHTNNSFDAFRSTAFSVSNLSAIFKGTSVVDDLKLVCLSDHNYFNYNDYVTNYAGFKANGILCLPGIEINTTNKIHWIFIFNDNQLAGTNDSGQKYGMLLEKAIYNFYGYNNAIPILKQTYTAQNTPVSLENFLDEINYLGIEFIAIPHFDKSCGGWFKHLKKDPEQLKLLDLFIRDNIIFGVESKQIKEFIKKNMEDTQFHLNSYLESFEKLDENISDEEKRKALEEIDRRRQHILKMCKIKNCVDKTSVIYGSDYHGDGAYDKSNLFIMKSELSFEGLKFALLDFDSRIFSIDKYVKCLKTNNYVIDNIVINENGINKTLQLGDGLNCIIGSRGSGKTYFLSMLLGETSKYTSINKSISLKAINFSNIGSRQKLSSEMFDYVAQKNGTGSINATKSNIYDLLARAPYDYFEFEKELKKSFNKSPDSRMQVDDFISLANEQIRNYLEINKIKNTKIDMKFLDSYNEFFQNKDASLEVYELINNFESFLNTASTNKLNELDDISDLKTYYDSYIMQLKKVCNFPEVKNIITEEELKKYFEYSTDINTRISKDANSKILINKSNIDKVRARVISINSRLKNEASNSQRILTDQMKNVNDYISNMVSYLRIIKKQKKELVKYNIEKLINQDVYIYKQGNNILKVRMEKVLILNSIPNKMYDEIFGNYINLGNGHEQIRKSFFENDFGEYFLSSVYNKKDGRRNSYLLNKPNITPNIYLTSDEDVEKNWLDLSPGQRSDMLLNIVLLNDSNKLLIIDQPEDDLDNETIYKKIVKRVRELKLKRQIIIVTHNANIAITADSDYFIICQSESDNSYSIINDTMESKKTYDYHSINNSLSNDKTALEIATEILDGGKEALKQRVKKIGYKDLFLEEV